MNRLLVVLMAAVLAGAAQAEPARILFHLNQAEQAETLAVVLDEVLRDMPDAQVRVVVHGTAILRFDRDDRLAPEFRALLAKGTRIDACSVSMKRAGVAEGRLVAGIRPVPEGGIARILALQRQGYAYIKI